eukprot:TRINITY_DN4221_c0_g1_i1.p1 TRINITY_DN4221_c0_g1~~TRINITY_DN4221_c0_g1_i1.p1  ORF type:complete len:873 (+),score=217.51 TRINITY_DN4221_c0_g1_i1:67-2685(+)
MGLIFELFLLVSLVGFSIAGNWAQVSGSKRQNTAISAVTTWSPRWGSAVTSILKEDPGPDYVEVPGDDSALSKVYFFGGDDYDDDNGDGSFHNDVWYTTGTEWEARGHATLKNELGDPLPRIISKLTWVQVTPDRVQPDGITYEDTLCCQTGWPCEFTSCYPKDFFETSRRWSPRRSHQAVTLNDKLFVMGGRSRAGEDISYADSTGSVITNRDRWRELDILVGDVWSSDDGVQWELLTPGCYVQQDDLIYGNGTSASQCTTTDDCVQAKMGDATCVSGKCVCNMWGPREGHRAVIFNDKIIVSGGFSRIETQQCGMFACGGRYRTFLNDVWESSDGKTWTPLTLNAPWPARGGHAFAVTRDRLWVYGGRGGDPYVKADNPLFNDVWSSADGITWTQHADAPWTAREQFVGLAHEEYLYACYGENDEAVERPPTVPDIPPQDYIKPDSEWYTENRLLNDCWVWQAEDGAEWLEDFSTLTESRDYVSGDSLLERLPRNFTDTEVSVYTAKQITTIRQLASLTSDEIEELITAGLTKAEVCDKKKKSEQVISTCDNTAWTTYGQDGFWANATIVYGAVDSFLVGYSSASATVVSDGCEDSYAEAVTTEGLSENCIERPTGRKFAASISFDSRLYMFGGLESDTTPANDVWYRDDVFPMGLFTSNPSDGSSDTYFKYHCTEPGCIFQYRFTKQDGTLLRDWTLSLEEVDLSDLLTDTGYYTFQLRALDPAGNADVMFEEGRNLLNWEYVEPLPWTLIIIVLLLIIIALIVLLLEYRRRKRKKKMERYAMKRMKRKFKGIQKKVGKLDIDWRKYYEKSKAGATAADIEKEMRRDLLDAAERKKQERQNARKDQKEKRKEMKRARQLKRAKKPRDME